MGPINIPSPTSTEVSPWRSALEPSNEPCLVETSHLEEQEQKGRTSDLLEA